MGCASSDAMNTPTDLTAARATRSAATTASIKHALSTRAAAPVAFDINAHLNSVLNGVGIAPESTGGAITFEGADPIVPSVFRLAAAAGTALVAKSAAMASLWALRTGEGQDIHL